MIANIAGEPHAARGNTVLVIEDMDAVRSVLAKMLRSIGFETLEARDGSEAVHIFAENSSTIVAATLDLMMPTTDGREMLAMLSQFAPNLPIVISTALPLPHDLIGRQPGTRGIGYLQKPYTGAELERELRRVIEETESRGGS